MEAKKLSAQQARFLKNLLNKQATNAHCYSQSDYGGLQSTLYSLLRKKLVRFGKHDLLLTPAGRKLAKTL